MNLVNPFWNTTPPPPVNYLVENFNGPALNSDWDGSGGTYTFPGGDISLTAGIIQSVRNDLDFSFKTITIRSDVITPTTDWFLLVGDYVGNTYIIEIRFQPSLGKVRLTQHTAGGGDTHHDFTYGALADVEWVQLTQFSGVFSLFTSSDGSTFTFRQNVGVDGGFVLTACQVGIAFISGGAVLLDTFDSDILV